jgi:pseudaminic acid cytidylyltransferase
MKKIAIIPARGGSKRIPRKNIKDFLGSPMISYPIIEALKSNLFDEVMVSTDDEEIADVALKYGAKVPFLRSKLNSQDNSTTVDVLLEVIDWYNSRNHFFDSASCLYPCNPFLNKEILFESFRLLIESNCDVVFPAVAYGHPVQRAFTIGNDNKIIPLKYSDVNQGTQLFEKSYHDAGMFYTFDIEVLKNKKSLRTENTLAIEVSELNAQDIDTINDWKIAELKYKLFFNETL